MPMSVYKNIQQFLDSKGIAYTTSHHEPVYTSQQAADLRGVPLESGAKAIVVRGSKTKEHALCVMPAHLKLDSKKIKQVLGESVSFAQDPEAVTGCVPGSVPPFGSVVGLKTYCDPRLGDNETINFNAGSLTDSIGMSYEDYVAAEQPTIVEIAKE